VLEDVKMESSRPSWGPTGVAFVSGASRRRSPAAMPASTPRLGLRRFVAVAAAIWPALRPFSEIRQT